ncbi:MAG: nitric oxide reductase [Bacteroidetes bacterium]|nr:MAG: nitric oxide reductase [Bacteroidota bacterium]
MNIDNKNIYYPPAGILLWIIIFVELLTFTIGIGVFLYQRSQDPASFSESAAMLNETFGVINTLVLITGGFMMATSLHQLKSGNNRKSLIWIRGASLMGVLFLVIKGYEYYEKMVKGLTIDYDSFYSFYWLLTGFHFIHVLVGVVILVILARGIRKGDYSKSEYLDVESGGAFWHMCDLIWLFLFPVMYLMG